MSMSNSPELSIGIDRQQASYSPGDTLRGRVMLKLFKDSTIGKVTVQLVGRSKSKIIQSNGQSTSTFRGSAVLLDIEKTLHNDHYTHKNGTLDWAFEFQIPEYIDLSCSKEVWQAREDFLTTAPESQSQPIPPSFRFAESGSSKAWQVLNSYAIEATIVQPQGSQLTKPTIRTSTRTIRILPIRTVAAVDMGDPRQRRGQMEKITIRTLRLLPEHTTSLSLMQRTRSFLSSSSLPRFTFDIDVSYPSSLQLYHPQALPFVVAAIPRTDPESTTIQPSMRTFYRYPPLRIKHLQLMLRATTMCRCPSILSEVSATASHDIVLADRHFSDMILAIRSVAWDQKNRVEEDTPTSIDLGKECNVHVTGESRNETKNSRDKNDKVEKEPARIRALVTPSFTTYNISRKYHLAWNIEFECVREKVIFKGQSADEILVLGPAASLDSGISSEDDMWTVIAGNDGVSGDENGIRRRSSETDLLPAYSETIGTELSLDSSAIAVSTGKS